MASFHLGPFFRKAPTARFQTAILLNKSCFFKNLPDGKYGVTFCESDECDSYTCVKVFSGLHYGANYLQVFDMSDSPDYIWEEGAEGKDCVEWKDSETVSDVKFRELIDARSEPTEDDKRDLVKIAEWATADSSFTAKAKRKEMNELGRGEPNGASWPQIAPENISARNAAE